MTSLANLPATLTAPRLVGGMRSTHSLAHIPARHAAHLAAWAAAHDCTPHADVAVTSIVQSGDRWQPTGPLGPFTPDEHAAARLGGLDLLTHSGWGIEIITGEQIIALTLREDGTINEHHRRPLSPPRPSTQAEPRNPGETLRQRAADEREARLQAERMRISRDVLIRERLDAGAGVPEVADLAGLGEQRIYQIRNERR